MNVYTHRGHDEIPRKEPRVTECSDELQMRCFFSYYPFRGHYNNSIGPNSVITWAVTRG